MDTIKKTEIENDIVSLPLSGRQIVQQASDPVKQVKKVGTFFIHKEVVSAGVSLKTSLHDHDHPLQSDHENGRTWGLSCARSVPSLVSGLDLFAVDLRYP
jgi:hypothetical protein